MPPVRQIPFSLIPFFTFGGVLSIIALIARTHSSRSSFIAALTRLIDTFVNAVFVYDDKLILTYNYQHGTQKITLKEVEDFLGSDLVGLSPPQKAVKL